VGRRSLSALDDDDDDVDDERRLASAATQLSVY
jgi:hypothetical protein